MSVVRVGLQGWLRTCSGSAWAGSLSGLKPLLYAMAGVSVVEGRGEASCCQQRAGADIRRERRGAAYCELWQRLGMCKAGSKEAAYPRVFAEYLQSSTCIQAQFTARLRLTRSLAGLQGSFDSNDALANATSQEHRSRVGPSIVFFGHNTTKCVHP